jgi:hypothetical protein
MQVATQLGEFQVSALKDYRGRPVGRVVVIDEGCELCHLVTQVDINPPRALGGFAIP